jgi:hypothetical protein
VSHQKCHGPDVEMNKLGHVGPDGVRRTVCR